MRGKLTGVFLFLGLAIAGRVSGQYDSGNYYAAYPNKITGRVYLSTKYTFLLLRNSKENLRLRYQPNTSINAGIGATYRWATLNIGVGVLNQNPSKGKTPYLDLQLHNYGRKFIVDMLGQFYKGFYLYPQGTGRNDDQFYQRPDLRINVLGGSFQYVMNHSRFSYRAAFLQNEWQKKSAGSLLFGLAAYLGTVHADSTLIPGAVNKKLANENIRIIRFFELGPNIGYAYTCVIRRHFFVTGSAAVTLGYGVNVIHSNTGKAYATGFSPNTILRFCAGYNSDRLAASLVYVNNGVQGATNHSRDQMTLNSGNLRLNFVKRIGLNNSEK